MKKTTTILLGIACMLALPFATQSARAEGGSIPSWAQPQIDKLSEAIPDLNDKQKTEIVEAIKVRGGAIKKAKESGAAGEDLKAQEKEAWSVYVRRMHEILTDEQFAKFEAQRAKETGKPAAK